MRIKSILLSQANSETDHLCGWFFILVNKPINDHNRYSVSYLYY